jgi:hypothetical protein
MSRQRKSLERAKDRLAYEERFKKSAEEIAVRAEVEIEIRGDRVYLRKNDAEETLCRVQGQKRFWYTVWRAMGARFPHLSRFDVGSVGKHSFGVSPYR